MPTTAAQAALATGTSIKTLLQIATPSTRQLQLVAWGYSFDDYPGDNSVIELLETDVAATVTAHGATGVQPLDPNLPASLVTLGTSATGYNASAEGSITATRVFDALSIDNSAPSPAALYAYQFMPDERPIVAVSSFLRVRVTMATSGTNVRAWVCWDE